jgi:cytochrome c oxidase assembly protein subunit 15
MLSASVQGPSTSIGARWPRRLAWLTAGATCALIVVGGLVTNTGSGLAVPDWPTTFGENMFLYPLTEMTGGVLYEHSHRLLGSLVGLLTVALSVALILAEPRPWVRTLGVVAVLVVVAQGVLGGLRVVLSSHGLAMIHGAVAPAFLALLASIALVTSPAGQEGPPGRATLQPLRPLALATVGTLYVQILLGVVLTHTGRRLDAHLLVAGLVSVLVPLLAARTVARGGAALARPARVLRALWALQLVLGLGAYGVRFHGGAGGALVALGFPLAHRLTGALMLAGAVVLTLQLFRLGGVTDAGEAAPAGTRVPA